MKTRNLFKVALSTLVVGSLFLTSCRKEKDEDNDTSDASDNALAEQTFNDMHNMANEAASSNTMSSYKNDPTNFSLLSGCVTITRDTAVSSNTDTITIDFGSSNCLCLDGRNRRGQIIITYTGKYRDSATVITITPNSYFVNDNQVIGTKVITNKGRNAAGNLNYDIVVNGSIILSSANGGGTITWQSNRNREWTAGSSTYTWIDDQYSITGSASGTKANGNSFTSQITSPLIRNMAPGCKKHFVQGTIDITPANKLTRTIDFGSGACDNDATVTINNNTYNIKLK
ncbi:MAG: hypothetical protein J0M08_11130 [Bacteroidetes bacterium]|nr:hypothetical protein [Bacteroidota bacterium]